jgi:predicted PurR-regulated permease PerM
MIKYPTRSERRFLLAQRITYTLLAIILSIYGIIAIRNFLYPIAFGFLLAYLLYPMSSWLERKRFPRILANFIAIISVIAIITGVVSVAFHLASPFAGELPGLLDKGMGNLSAIVANLGSFMGFNRETTRIMAEEQILSMLTAGGENLRNFFSATASTMIAIGLLPVYIFLFLYYRNKFAYFLLKVASPEKKPAVVAILREVSKVSSRYVGGVIVVVSILCVLNPLGLWIIGIRFPIALGIIAALFNIIPYFGTLLGFLVPLIFAMVIENSPVLAVRVILLFVVIQFTENNILTPNIVGGNVKINPFFIITGLVAASLIWGIPGMLLIVPFLAIMRIIFSHIDSMKPYAYLLGQEGTDKHAITIDKIRNFFSGSRAAKKKPAED